MKSFISALTVSLLLGTVVPACSQAAQPQKQATAPQSDSVHKTCPAGIKASSVVIDEIRYGTIVYGLDQSLTTAKAASRQPREVIVLTKIPPARAKRAIELGLRAGAAYTRSAGGFNYLCDVDPKLSVGQIAKLFGVSLSPPKPPEERVPTFKPDPSAAVKLQQIHDCRVLDRGTQLKNKIAELEKISDTRHFVSIPNVIIMDDARFLLAPTAAGTPKEYSPLVMLLVRVGNDRVLLATPRDHSVVARDALSRTNADINGAVEALYESPLPNPAVLLIDKKLFDDPYVKERSDEVVRGIVTHSGQGLAPFGFDSHKGTLLFANPIPNYLIGKGDTFTYFDILDSFRRPNYGRLSDLVDPKADICSSYPEACFGLRPYLLVPTSNSAPVELKPGDLEQISTTKVSALGGSYTVALSMKNGTKITFGGLSAVNSDFMKSDDTRWNPVIGLSSAHGFTVAIRFTEATAKGTPGLNLFPALVVSKNPSIQDKLPAGVVEMVSISVAELTKSAKTRPD